MEGSHDWREFGSLGRSVRLVHKFYQNSCRRGPWLRGDTTCRQTRRRCAVVAQLACLSAEKDR
ncbi:hypothetical protein HMPREF1868_00203 [Olsenella sp. DNF00959]|nr:hypothetical protein HMPREF1868_00203 [Olsenella sp. DNF00959]